MKILHAISGTATRGTESGFEQTVVALSRHGVAQRVLLPRDSGRKGRLKTAGLEPLEVPFRARFDFSSKRRLNQEIASFEPDVVVSWTADVAERVRVDAAKHVGYAARDFPVSSYQSCDHVFALSQQRIDRAVATGWPADKAAVLPSMIPIEDMKPIDRKTFFTPETAKLIVAVGHLTPEQGLDLLIDAVARISGLYVWIVGDGPENGSLLERALEAGIKPRTRFTGYQFDTLNLIAEADLVVCPARQDDRGEQVLGAWACGKPVIAADSIGPGLLIKHRENGVLVPIDDARSLSEAIKWVNQDSAFASRIAAAGAENFAKSHALSVVIPKYLDYFETVVAAGPDTGPDAGVDSGITDTPTS